MSEEKKNPPIDHVRAGNVDVPIWEFDWEFEGKKGTRKTITLQREYKDKNGKPKSTGHVKISDIPDAIAALQEVYRVYHIQLRADKLAAARNKAKANA